MRPRRSGEGHDGHVDQPPRESGARLLDGAAAIEVVYHGDVGTDVLVRVSGEALGLAREHGVHHVLTDCSTMTSDPSVFSLYDLAALLGRLGVTEVYREAVLMSELPQLHPGFEIYENTMSNRGLTVRCFRHRDKALSWLTDRDDDAQSNR